MNAFTAHLRTFHRCACGRTYTLSQWLKLRLIGLQREGEQVLELRNCVCGSTCSEEVALAAS